MGVRPRGWLVLLSQFPIRCDSGKNLAKAKSVKDVPERGVKDVLERAVKDVPERNPPPPRPRGRYSLKFFNFQRCEPASGVLELPGESVCAGVPRLVELAPSILSADFAHLADQVRSASEGGASVIHVDIMDGHFVPNMTIGPPVIKSLRRATDLPLDCHLMIEDPDQFIPMFAEAGADWMSVHQEACRHLDRTLHLIKSHNCLAGVVINPATPVETLTEVLDIVDYVLVMSVNPGFGAQEFIPGSLHKLRRLAEMRARRGLNYRLEVDGGVSLETVAEVVRAGAEILVAGNAVFGHGDPTDNARKLLKAATEATLQRV